MKQRAAVPLAEDGHVKELLAILRDNGMNARDLTGIVWHVAAMECEIGKAVSEVSALRKELSELREARGHPIKAMLEKASGILLAKLKGLRAQISDLKNNITDGCRKAVEAFKGKGASALNHAAESLNVKSGLESLRGGIEEAIGGARGSVEKIGNASIQYHMAGAAVKNIGRAIRGKEAVSTVKPNGPLAGLIAAPYHSQIERLQKSLNFVNKALALSDALEKSAARRAETAKPSALEAMKTLQKAADQQKMNMPAKERSKKPEAAI